MTFSPGLLCDLLWSDPDKDVQGWGENDRGVSGYHLYCIVYKCPQPITCNFLRQVSFTFGADVVSKFLNRHDLDLICRAHQVRLAVRGWIEYIKHIVLHHKCESAMAMSAVSRCC